MIAWLVTTLVASTLLMLLVLAIRNPVRRAFGPTVAYALWSLPAMRMILPPLPESWRQGESTPLAQAAETLAIYVGEPLGIPVQAAGAEVGGPLVWPWVLAAWLVGAVAFIGYHMIAHGRFCARVRRTASNARVVAKGNVSVIETDAAAGPLAFGVWRKYVAFPRDFSERYDPLERDLALAHELGHHARGDLIANWAALVVLAIHWCNPVAWYAFRAFRADQEMACDALVLAGRAAQLRHAYGRAIVKSAHGGAVSAACHLHTVNEIKGRLRMLTLHERKSRSRMLTGTATVIAVTLGSLGATASGTRAAERVRSGVEDTIGVDLASLELPPLPQLHAVAGHASAAATASAVAVGAAGDRPRIERRHVRAIVRDRDGKVREDVTIDGEPGVHVLRIDRDGDRAARKRADGVRKDVKSYAFIVRDGKGKDLASHGMPDVAHFERFPIIVSRACGDAEGSKDATTIDGRDGARRSIVICTDRIERQAAAATMQAERARHQMAAAATQADHADRQAAAAARQAAAAARQAERAERSARVARAAAAVRVRRIELQAATAERARQRSKLSALTSLRSARRTIEINRNLTDTQRNVALAGIDEAIRDMAGKSSR